MSSSHFIIIRHFGGNKHLDNFEKQEMIIVSLITIVKFLLWKYISEYLKTKQNERIIVTFKAIVVALGILWKSMSEYK